MYVEVKSTFNSEGLWKNIAMGVAVISTFKTEHL